MGFDAVSVPVPQTRTQYDSLRRPVKDAATKYTHAPSKQAQSQCGAAPASDPSPTGPVLRANPCPEVTDLACRLPLPTLFYRLEAVHLGDLLRIWVRSGAKIKFSPSDFQGPAGALRTPQEPRCFTETTSLSPGEPIPGSPFLTKKRQLFPGLLPTSPSSFALPHWIHEGSISASGFGNINPIPFRSFGGGFLIHLCTHSPIRNGFPLFLRAD